MSATTASARPLLVRLQLEWDRLSRSPRALAEVQRWPLCAGPVGPSGTLGPSGPAGALGTVRFASLDDLLRAAGYGTVAKGGHADDAVLAELVRLAHRHELAARVVLQRLLPGISALARRHHRVGRPRAELLDDLVATAWTVIRTYPADRRPQYVAANLLRTIHYQAVVRPTRRRATFVPTPHDTFDRTPAAPPTPTAAEELDELLALAELAGLDAVDVDLARRLGRGESTIDVARSAAVTDRTVRNHRARVAHRLRHVALATD